MMVGTLRRIRGERVQQQQGPVVQPGGRGWSSGDGWAVGGCLLWMLLGIGTVALIFAWPFLLTVVFFLVALALAIRLLAHLLALFLPWIRPDDRDLR